jgi:hypothetical protein
MTPVNDDRNAGNAGGGSGRGRVGGWLLVLCLLLLVWQPFSLALVASSALDSLAVRGLPLALVLLMRVFVAAFGIAAGLALARRRPGAVALAKLSLIMSAAADVFVYTTPYFPNNRPPGTTPFYVAASLAYSGMWLVYLIRSTRVHNTY